MFYHELNPKIDYSRSNLRWNAWGANDQDFGRKAQMPEILKLLQREFKLDSIRETPAVSLKDIKIPNSKLSPNDIKNLSAIVGKNNFKNDRYERVFHSAGRSYYDVLRLHFNTLKSFVDGVVYPKKDSEIIKILEYCSKNKITVIPFGGGSSVVGGVEVLKGKGQKAVISLDMTEMKELVSFDPISMTATFQAGIYGPKLEYGLNLKGYTLGHFPQSFEYSTLGGWVAARSAGQQSNRYGKIEEILSAVKLISPKGTVETLRAPASSIGPDWNQIIAGSEGLLGIISEVTVKIHKIPETRKYFGLVFPDLLSSINFIRKTNQEEIKTSMMRLSDANETRLYEYLGELGKTNTPIRKFKKFLQNSYLRAAGIRDNKCVILVGLDGSRQEVDHSFQGLKKLWKKGGAIYAGEKLGQNWIHSRYNMPFLRNHVMQHGMGVDTMETSSTYDKLEDLHKAGIESLQNSIPGSIAMCHLSHSYHEGACLYYTILFPMDAKKPEDQWLKMKRAVSDTFTSFKVPISHHHGVGFDHKKWYESSLGKPGIEALNGLKKVLDQKEILNPGKLFHS
ncbi:MULTISPECIES: FAD-binding oxidoreductase [unclassified Leptospira]|uniref:FAD-binding oxidoreductase n=1 Tax=unclassified Leptospira TaxID=2633828 RepID=UPI0002BD39EA|nr:MULTISPECIES: FAD-binding oxidoreductase [unclassified Leptospira]EMJ96976.1 FAD linked oxidase, C-terminal domain protein [Leptospira sp. B5-022]MCR1794583.1 FAD-binding oxidoreductase [Leptospira sp. id769339]